MSVRIGSRVGPLSVSAPLTSRTIDRAAAGAAGDTVTAIGSILIVGVITCLTGFGIVTVTLFLLYRLVSRPFVERRRVDFFDGLLKSAIVGGGILAGILALAILAGVLFVLSIVVVGLWSMGWFGLLVLAIVIIASIGAASK